MSETEIIVLYDVEGKPIPLREDETFDFGHYSPSTGKTIKMFIRNITENKHADISDYHILESNAIFEGPDTLTPGETAPCKIRILPNPDISLDDFDLDDLPKDNLHLKGKTIWTNHRSMFE